MYDLSTNSNSQLPPRFDPVSLLARSAASVVMKGLDQQTGKLVAVKVLVSDEGDALQHAAFLREASLLSRLKHPCTVKVVDYGVHAGVPYLATEYFEGVTLAERMAGELSLQELVAILRAACAGLAEAHRMGIVHADVTPRNLMVRDLDVQIIDFGLATESVSAVSVTGDGVMSGTPLYMSPEQIRGRRLDARSDVYSLGIVLYEGIAGRTPFYRRQTAATLMAHLSEEVPPLALVAPDCAVPDCLQAVIARCLQKAREDRFSSVVALDEALALVEAVLSGEQSDESARSAIQPKRRQSLANPQSAWRAGGLALAGLLPLALAYVGAQGVLAVTSHDAGGLQPISWEYSVFETEIGSLAPRTEVGAPVVAPPPSEPAPSRRKVAPSPRSAPKSRMDPPAPAPGSDLKNPFPSPPETP